MGLDRICNYFNIFFSFNSFFFYFPETVSDVCHCSQFDRAAPSLGKVDKLPNTRNEANTPSSASPDMFHTQDTSIHTHEYTHAHMNLSPSHSDVHTSTAVWAHTQTHPLRPFSF